MKRGWDLTHVTWGTRWEHKPGWRSTQTPPAPPLLLCVHNLFQSWNATCKMGTKTSSSVTVDWLIDGNDNPICKTEKETQMYRTDFWTLWEKARVGCFERTPSKHVYYYLGWNRSPAQTGYTRQVHGPGALGRPRGIGWRGRWEGWSGWGTH